MRYVLPLLLAASLLVAGCGDERTSPAYESGTSAAGGGRTGKDDVGNDVPTPEAQGGTKTTQQANGDSQGPARPRTGYQGKWLVIASRMDVARESRIAVIEIGKQGEKYTGKVLDSSKRTFPDAKLTTTEVGDDGIHLVFELGESGRLDVRGKLDRDTIYGNAPTNAGLQPVRLVPTEKKKLESPESGPTPAADAFEEAITSDDVASALLEFARKFPQSPTALSAYFNVLIESKEKETDLATLEQAIDDLIKTARRWGPRMVQNTRLDAAAILVQQEYLPDLAVKTLEPLAGEMADEKDDELKSRYDLTSAMARVLSSDEATREAGGAALEKLQQAKPLDHRLRVALAKYHDNAGNQDAALTRFAELASLPDGEMYLSAINQQSSEKGESAAEAAKRLWQAIHGEKDGLDEFLRETYDKSLQHVFAAKPAPPPTDPAGKQVVLCELFTGAGCHPCVAADVATAGLEATYPKSRLIVLRYHQHIPLPDPMTNADGETRFAYYEGESTPTVVVNGGQVPEIGGPFAYSQMMYETLRESVDKAVEAESSLTIRLSAEADGGQVMVKADVAGMKALPKSARLRLALAEDLVNFDASNGIRLHEMVVRHMPGGPEGIAVEGGRLSYESTLDLVSIRQGLVDYLDRMAKQFDVPGGLPPELAERMPDGPFSARPLEFKAMHLVAFVQDDASQKVLQAAAVPVAGRLELPELPSEKRAAPADVDEEGAVRAPVPPAASGGSDDQSGTPLPPFPPGKKAEKSGPKLIPPGGASSDGE